MSQEAEILEEWREIKGYEGRYEVSNMGNVRSIPRQIINSLGRKRNLRSVLLKKNHMKSGYMMITLGNGKNVLVHRLVAKAFIPNKECRPCVNHLDGNKGNNTVNNLQWVTYSENERHSYDVLGKKPNKSALGKIGILSPYSKVVHKYSKDGKLLEVYFGASEAARQLRKEGFIKASQGRVSCCARGETKTAYGFVFKYKGE